MQTFDILLPSYEVLGVRWRLTMRVVVDWGLVISDWPAGQDKTAATLLSSAVLCCLCCALGPAQSDSSEDRSVMPPPWPDPAPPPQCSPPSSCWPLWAPWQQSRPWQRLPRSLRLFPPSWSLPWILARYCYCITALFAHIPQGYLRHTDYYHLLEFHIFLSLNKA